MPFDILQFARANRLVLIWAAFAGLVYLLKDMFGLVFLTYIMCFVTHSLTPPMQRRLGLPRRLCVLFIYLTFLLLLGAVLFYLLPTLVRETRAFTEQLPRAFGIIDAWVEANAANHAWLPEIMTQIKEYLTPEQVVLRGWVIGRGLLERGIQYTSWFFLAFMFSFLIMLDLPRMVEGARALSRTRLAAVYEATADSVVLFARVVGEYFRAQILVSAINTALTGAGLILLGVNGIVLLCTLSFLCGLVPVLGFIIAAIPTFFMAVNSGGISLGIGCLLMISAISLLETYVLNPRIVSAVMRLNPVMTLLILYMAYILIGLWGLILGVPIAVYIHRRLGVAESR